MAEGKKKVVEKRPSSEEEGNFLRDRRKGWGEKRNSASKKREGGGRQRLPKGDDGESCACSPLGVERRLTIAGWGKKPKKEAKNGREFGF